MFDKEYFSKDIFDFLVILCKHKVKFVLVGGEAVIYYGHARLTGDIDIYYELAEENIGKLWNALLEFWDDNIPIIKSKNEFNKSGIVVQFGLPPNRIDLINTIEGIEFNEVWENKTTESLDLGNGESLEIYLIGIKELIKNKESAARHKDLEDVKFLKAINAKKK
jgi:hypothetical protein